MNDIIPVYKLFTVCKERTDVKGFWKQGGKIYIDNISIKEFPLIRLLEFKREKEKLFNKGERAVFYINHKGQGIIENIKGEKVILYNKTVYNVIRLKVSVIRALLNEYGGCTVYREKNNYRIEIYY